MPFDLYSSGDPFTAGVVGTTLQGQASPGPQTAGGFNFGSLLPSLPSLPELPKLSDIPGVGTVSDVASGASKFFDTITSGDFWERVIFIILGLIMIALAIFFFAKHEAVTVVAGAVKGAVK